MTKQEEAIANEVFRTLTEEKQAVIGRILKCSKSILQKMNQQKKDTSELVKQIRDIRKWQETFGEHPAILGLYDGFTQLRFDHELIIAKLDGIKESIEKPKKKAKKK